MFNRCGYCGIVVDPNKYRLGMVYYCQTHYGVVRQFVAEYISKKEAERNAPVFVLPYKR